MKKTILILALITIIVSGTVLMGCVRVDLSEKNGPIITEQYYFTDFTGIDVGDIFELQVIPSDNYSVAITTNTDIFQHIHVSKNGSTLKVDMDTWLFTWYTAPKVTITMPVIEKLVLSGASKASVLGFKSTHDFDLSLSGASQLDANMEMGRLVADISGAGRVTGYFNASSTNIELSGASSIRATGSGGNARLHGSGASDFDLENYSVNDADIELSGTSHASILTGGRLDVGLSGASSLEYTGSPILGNINTSGTSSMHQKSRP
ncbi:MAG: head GIN domain-containing protein [Dehalococcoidales bacterium]